MQNNVKIVRWAIIFILSIEAVGTPLQGRLSPPPKAMEQGSPANPVPSLHPTTASSSTRGGGGSQKFLRLTDLVYFFLSKLLDRGGGGGVVTEISEAHRPSVLFIIHYQVGLRSLGSRIFGGGGRGRGQITLLAPPRLYAYAVHQLKTWY